MNKLEWAAVAVVSVLVAGAGLISVQDGLGDGWGSDRFWIVSVTEMRGPPEGTAQAYPVNDTTLRQHPLIWNLTQQVREGKGSVHVETDATSAQAALLDFAEAIGAGKPSFLMVYFEYEGAHYSAFAGQIQA